MAPAVATSASDERPPRRRAVVVGVDVYRDDRIENLHGAANDAREVHEQLTTAGNFEVLPQHFLLNSDATAENVRAAVSDLLWDTERSDLSLLYFSGHGLIDSYGNGYMALHDMDRQRPLIFGLRMQELRELLLAANDQKKTIVVLLDCCYSGIAAEGSKGDLDVPPHLVIDECLSPLNSQGSGRMIFTSSPKDEKSRESAACQHRLRAEKPHEHGLFTFHILEGLDGGAAGGGGDVTLGSLITYVENGLRREREPRPRFFGSSLSELDAIHLVRASKLLKVEEWIESIRDGVAAPGVRDLFRAIERLGQLTASAPGLSEVSDLQATLDDRLEAIQFDAVDAMLGNRLRWSEGCEATFDRLEQVAGTLTCEAILREEPRMRGLVAALLEFSCEHADERTLMRYLLAYATPARHEAGPNIAGVKV